MVFSSPVFIFLFLPVVLSLYFLVPRVFKNIFLLIASLFFYAWGGVSFIGLVIFSIIFNYAIALLIDRGAKSRRKMFLVIGLVVNILMIGFFKYSGFIVETMNYPLSVFNLNEMSFPDVPLPIGISFYTFMAISYIVDVYVQKIKGERKVIDFGLYITLFPHLIAGPIVRYEEIRNEIKERNITVKGFSKGVQRFIIGLAKKVLIANTLAIVVDDVFSLKAEFLSIPLSWIVIILYAFQIYYDFSGYSDMAIGLALMLGFKFPENFNFPYISTSIKEFWRRWHMSLSRWFRDYVYIPLGGNRVSPIRTDINIMLVFFLTGLWHGASWTFVIWGAYYGVLLVIEGRLRPYLEKVPILLRYAATMLLVLIGWVFFRADTITHAFEYLHAMFVPNSASVVYSVREFMDIEKIAILLVALFFAVNPSQFITDVKNVILRGRDNTFEHYFNRVVSGIYLVMLVLLFIFSVASLASGTYNPFIYFRF